MAQQSHSQGYAQEKFKNLYMNANSSIIYSN